MSVLKRRSHVVTFRVSADEYAALVRSSVDTGSRSVAEFVRAAALDRTRSVPEGTLSGSLSGLSNALVDLDKSLLAARRRISSVLGRKDPITDDSNSSEGDYAETGGENE